jgi:nitroimidazol reductase NimA-like FMN-containing flavoprotein (pyridoxamine 5'-phosphate oxidase superfamily)
MRRGDREITDRARIDNIVRRCTVCHLGLISDGEPYVVPLSFGYDGVAVYLHMAPEGRKVDALRTASRVCLEWEIPGELTSASEACSWGTRFESVIAWGTPEIVTDEANRRAALDLIMAHYAGESGTGRWTYDEGTLARTVIVRIPLEEVTGKARN